MIAVRARTELVSVYALVIAGRLSARRAARVRSGGFPCRFHGCRVCFVVSEEGSMPALAAASERRTQHEIAAHDYRHQRLEEHPRGPLGAVHFTPKPRTS